MISLRVYKIRYNAILGVVFLRGKIQINKVDKVDQMWYTISVLKIDQTHKTNIKTEVF